MLVLASSSKTRQRLLRDAGFDFEIKVSNAKEKDLQVPPPEVACVKIAKRKLEGIEGDVVLAADTFCWFNNKILGKPKNKKEAEKVLKSLSENWVDVYTGVAIKTKGFGVHFFDKSRVKFRKLDNDEISEYTKSFAVENLAGSFSLYGYGTTFVERIEGDFFSVAGLPLGKLTDVLKRFGVKPSIKNAKKPL